jgi:hypothetical protein
MRMMDGSTLGGTSKPERKVVHNASSKVSLVVHKMLLPLLDAPLQSHVVFDVEADQDELDLLARMNQSRPALMEDQLSFVEHLQALFNRYKAYADGYRLLDTADTGTASRTCGDQPS